MVAHGFNFVRLPFSYRFWTHDFDYARFDEPVLKNIDGYLAACHQRGLHASINLHRAPGYCIVFGSIPERHNLWTDPAAQDAFIGQWRMFAARYRGIAPDKLSFDLLNEPPEIGRAGFSRDIHEKLIRQTIAAIREIDPARPIVIDGLDGGNVAMPELADVGATHSGRGYQPYPVSHWGATWWDGWKAGDSPEYPGTRWDKKIWNRETLLHNYQPWRELAARGVNVHIGEFGCFNQTPDDSARRWFGDLLSIFAEQGWGYALWEFEGPFGIVNHGRPGASYKLDHGFQVDAALLELLINHRR